MDNRPNTAVASLVEHTFYGGRMLFDVLDISVSRNSLPMELHNPRGIVGPEPYDC